MLGTFSSHSWFAGLFCSTGYRFHYLPSPPAITAKFTSLSLCLGPRTNIPCNPCGLKKHSINIKPRIKVFATERVTVMPRLIVQLADYCSLFNNIIIQTTIYKPSTVYALLWYHAHPPTELKRSSLEEASLGYSKLSVFQVLCHDYNANTYDFFLLFARRRIIES